MAGGRGHGGGREARADRAWYRQTTKVAIAPGFRCQDVDQMRAAGGPRAPEWSHVAWPSALSAQRDARSSVSVGDPGHDDSPHRRGSPPRSMIGLWATRCGGKDLQTLLRTLTELGPG